MATVTDARFNTLRGQLYTGAANDMLLKWLQDNSGVASPVTVPDAWDTFLDAQYLKASVTITRTGDRSTDWFNLLRFWGYTGAISDMLLAFWVGGAVLPA